MNDGEDVLCLMFVYTVSLFFAHLTAISSEAFLSHVENRSTMQVAGKKKNRSNFKFKRFTLELEKGFEPSTSSLRVRYSTS